MGFDKKINWKIVAIILIVFNVFTLLLLDGNHRALDRSSQRECEAKHDYEVEYCTSRCMTEGNTRLHCQDYECTDSKSNWQFTNCESKNRNLFIMRFM